MGLFTALLTLPLAPVRGVVWVTEQVMEETERRFYDEQAIRAELLELEFAAEDGAMSPEELRDRQDALLERLSVSHARRMASAAAGEARDEQGVDPHG
ncbi:MAG TPA: gas vesicle protein GvpG [Solirubrobacteraceae bacterium]|nr:gas vesicle protein GvpG [Solirubrobacteraceae bacterium]